MALVRRKKPKERIIIDGVEHIWMNWCTGYYTRKFCREKIDELIYNGECADAKIGSKSDDYDYDENGKKIHYYRIRVLVPKTIHI